MFSGAMLIILISSSWCLREQIVGLCVKLQLNLYVCIYFFV